ncbi:LytTR family DNA-binding domain-containing protein [Chitinophaga vietnamensis]|uniref:LytTR family DNA-binding domain-containing protein n=1 Tax=Chitinophaga vietnamensis TaxID=2593957 RepID=UPI00137581D5|nr:LytTR family DNA-binding domain-containing protein [Chitinophaga vietnamensis]
MSRKYPFDTIKFKSILIISLAIALIIYLYKPFGFVNYEKNKIVGALCFGAATFICLIICNYVLKGRILKKNHKRWTILSEIGYILFVLLFISFFNGFIFLFLIGDSQSFLVADTITKLEGMLYILFLTAAVGMLPIITIIMIRYNRTLKNNLSKIIQSDETLVETDTNKQLLFPSLNTTDKPFSIAIHDFLFLEVVKNHIHVYYMEDGHVTTRIIRNTLTAILDEIDEASIFRCHRSFMVNLSKIKTAQGNSNGYKIILKDYENPIPVSRNFAPAFQKIIH